MIWQLVDGAWTLQIGRIGCIVIDPELSYPTCVITGWKIHWHEQCNYQFSEGIRLEPANYRFPFTDDGLQQAKQAGVEFAQELLTEALNALRIQ